MATPTTRIEFAEYCKRALGAPVLEINVADEQVEDRIDDALQLFYERHFDGVSRVFLKYEVTQGDIDRGKASLKTGVNRTTSGITTETTSTVINGETKTFTYHETSNYLQIPPSVIGINKIYQFDGSFSMSSGMFSIKYQLFLNDLYYWGSTELLTYSMVKRYLEDLDWILNPQKQIRFNQRLDRLYLDIDWSTLKAGEFLIIDCYRTADPNDYPRVWNDSFLKMYATALIKRQWGSNLMKFQGVKLPGGVELNGRQIYDDAQRELDIIMERMDTYYQIPVMDEIG
jgi:hypothetical protein